MPETRANTGFHENRARPFHFFPYRPILLYESGAPFWCCAWRFEPRQPLQRGPASRQAAPVLWSLPAPLHALPRACIAPPGAPDSRPILFRFAPLSESEQNPRNPRHDWVSRESDASDSCFPSASDSPSRIGRAFLAPSRPFALRPPSQKAKRAKGLPPARYFSPPRSKPLIPVTPVYQISRTSDQKLSGPDRKCVKSPSV